MLQQDINKISEELAKIIRQEIQEAKRPADEIVYDDVALRFFLDVSKRTTATWREKGVITFSKLNGKIYYRLSDILLMLKQHEVPAVNSILK